MAVDPKGSTIKAALNSVWFWCLSNDDPEGLGRICIYLDTWAESKVPEENGLWAFTQDINPKTAGTGTTIHSEVLRGCRGKCDIAPAGRATITAFATSFSGPDTPEGAGQEQPGEVGTYPSIMPDKGTS